MNAPAVQRWLTRRATWRPAGEPFRPARHEVAVLEESDAKRFTIEHHYSGSYPASRFRVGLFRADSTARHSLAGVCVFSVPMNGASLPRYCGVDQSAGAELGRFVLLDEVEGNGETWFLARAFELLAARRPEILAILSYSDPIARVNADGRTITPGHVGTIYQAFNGRYLGRTGARILTITADGRTVSPRALSKLRNDERGAGHVYAMLRRNGAPERQPFEPAAAYLDRALRSGPFRRFAHPGNHRYAWPIGNRRQRAKVISAFAPAITSYPKRTPALL